ncbi:hypothetical protein BDP55DRAFT_686729 [Colletotrichum godetiae]|uniref:Uncharacterized protein n=1 Tax=Colletotrichum godetiae TaxID=1209918 RepID=A0AAJ0A8R0_9PEZI|nr:uncharacterized protein BDP55DRAFT_686729 [Colletotrichum godetiae]KAK1657131.1 hypothetical protein BDP55DRAFT_686729 [Colletotrichum godetiae]
MGAPVAMTISQKRATVPPSIIATAIPNINREFQSLDQAGWYGSGFLLTLAGFVSLWGKAFKHASIKWVFLPAAVVLNLAV